MKLLRIPLILLALASGTSARAEIAASATAASPIGKGARAPAANVVAATGESLALADVLGGRPTLLLFYRGGWCPYCNKHLAAVAEVEKEFLDMGWQIVALSPDTAASLAATSDKQHLGYRLFSDRAMEASAAFGLAFRVDDATVGKYKEYNIDLPPVPGDAESRWLPVPAAYLVDSEGVIRFAYTNPDYRTRIDPAGLLAAARAAGE